VDAFAEEIERSGNPTGIEPGDRGESRIDGLSCHESVGKALGEPVVADEAEDLLLAGEVEQCAAEH
jgi:hypothetical protein